MTGILSGFYAAVSALQAQQSQSALISGNIANANTPGYVQRDLPLAEAVTGGNGDGVLAGPIRRLGSATLEASANQAGGAQAYSQTMADALSTYAQTVGQPSDTTSLPSTLSAFRQSLTTLSSAPANAVAQEAAVTAAQGLVGSLNGLSAAVEAGRAQADAGVASGVAAVNSTLAQIAQNQTALQGAAAQGNSTAPYEDTQATLIASLSQYVPVQVTDEGSSGINITTAGGTSLYDGTAHDLSFTPGTSISATSGPLSAVQVDGKTLPAATSGSIAANLQLRDVTLPAFQNQLDQIAGNLITTFQAADPTVNATTPTGIFTAGGAALSATSPTAGLAGSIALNASVDPAQNGEAFRMAAGANATSQPLTSDNSTVLKFVTGMQQTGTYTASTGMPGSLDLANASSQAAGLQQAAASQWTTLNTSRTAQARTAQTNLTNQEGVSVDAQLQRLLVVQQTYSASSEVVQAVMKMLDQINQIAMNA